MGQLLQHRLSSERLKPYVTAAQGDLDRAAELYQWNAEIASAFHLVIGHFEVVLRNALHGQLTIWHHNRGRTGEWYDDPAGVLDLKRRDDIADARRRLRGRPETPGASLRS